MMSAFEPRDWHTLDMATKIRLFSLRFPKHLPKQTRPNHGINLPRLDSYLSDPPPRAILVRHDTSVGAWRIAQRAE